LFRGSAGHALPGRLSDPAPLHISLHRSTLPVGRIYIALPDPDGDEDGRQADRQAGALDATNRFLLRALHTARCGFTGLPVLRVLQL